MYMYSKRQLYECVCVCVCVSLTLPLSGCQTLSPPLRAFLDKARANIFINGRMVKRHGEREDAPPYCGASLVLSMKC